MASFRYIDPAIRRSQSMSKLTYRQRDLWIGLILTSDDQGRRESNPALIRSDVWPYEDVALADIDDDLKQLEEIGFILRYTVDSKDYLQIINWHKYQKRAEWLAPSNFPAPPGWNDRYRYHGKGNSVIASDNWKDDDEANLPNSLPTSLPTRLPTTLPRRDVKIDGDVKGEGEGDDDVDIVPPSGGNIITQSDMKHFAEMTNLKPPTDQKHIAEWIQSLSRHREIGTTDAILRQTLTELAGKRYNITGPKSLEVPCMNTIAKTKRSRKERPRDCDGEFRDCVHT